MLRSSTQWADFLRVQNGKRFSLFGHIKIAVDLGEKYLGNNGHHPTNTQKPLSNSNQIRYRNAKRIYMNAMPPNLHTHSAHHYEFLWWHKPLAYILQFHAKHIALQKITYFIVYFLNFKQNTTQNWRWSIFFISLFLPSPDGKHSTKCFHSNSLGISQFQMWMRDSYLSWNSVKHFRELLILKYKE